MSRSYKKTPRSGDKKDKFYKQYANKLVRKASYDLPLNYGNYRKMFSRYKICDCNWVGTTYWKYLDDKSATGLEDCLENYLRYLRWYIWK